MLAAAAALEVRSKLLHLICSRLTFVLEGVVGVAGVGGSEGALAVAVARATIADVGRLHFRRTRMS